MLFPRSRKTAETTIEADDRSRLADLEAAQRRDVYAAGRGDGPDRSRRPRRAARRPR
jgi:hypothetical protein